MHIALPYQLNSLQLCNASYNLIMPAISGMYRAIHLHTLGAVADYNDAILGGRGTCSQAKRRR
jgi:hypothetical protein